MKLKTIKTFFVIAGFYDLILGFAFAFLWSKIYSWANVSPQFLPGHSGYMNLLGLMVLIFGIGFLMVAANPVTMRAAAILGLLFKIAYVAVVIYYAVGIGLPTTLFLIFAIIDIGFALGIIFYLITPVSDLSLKQK